MEQLIKELIKELENSHDFESEFYQTYCCGLNDGDISDWYDTHFDDNIERGFRTGQTAHAEEMIISLKEILEKCKGE
jgi:hypothetical protein